MWDPIKAVPADEETYPTCPHCSEELDHILYKELQVSHWQPHAPTRAYLCPHCFTLLSVAEA